jgi:hypothetical protein
MVSWREAMSRRGDRDAVWMAAWVLGVLLLAGLGGGVGAFLFGVWTTVGIVALMRSRLEGAVPGETAAMMGAALAVVGLLWWWATEPDSALASAAGYLGPVFLGGTVGAVVGLGIRR